MIIEDGYQAEMLQTLDDLVNRVEEQGGVDYIVEPIIKEGELTYASLSTSKLQMLIETMTYRKAKGLRERPSGLPVGLWIPSVKTIMLDPHGLIIGREDEKFDTLH